MRQLAPEATTTQLNYYTSQQPPADGRAAFLFVLAPPHASASRPIVPTIMCTFCWLAGCEGYVGARPLSANLGGGMKVWRSRGV